MKFSDKINLFYQILNTREKSPAVKNLKNLDS